jgi:hypothetical protein
MDPVVRQFLQELRINKLFHASMKEISKHRPVVPAYKPGQSREEADSLMERIKFESGRKEGFDLLYLLLTGDRNE